MKCIKGKYRWFIWGRYGKSSLGSIYLWILSILDTRSREKLVIVITNDSNGGEIQTTAECAPFRLLQ